MKKLLTVCLAWLLVYSSPALAAWSVTNLISPGNPWNHCSTCSTISITTNQAVPANGLIIVQGYVSRAASSGETLKATDSAGDTFNAVLCQDPSLTTDFTVVLYAISTSGLSSGGTVTFSTVSGSNANDMQFIGSFATGGVTVSPNDSSVNACNGGSTSNPSQTSGTPSQSGDLLVGVYGGEGSPSFTEDATWTGTFVAGDGTTVIGGAYFNNSGSGTKTRSLTASAVNWTMGMTGFKLAGVSAAKCNRLLLGVGC